MNDKVWLFYNGWGIVMLGIFAGSYSLSHFFWLKKLPQVDFGCKVTGFIALVLLFFLSGWKAGLLALPIGFVCSCVAAVLVSRLKRPVNR
jgi:hypothetical protein